MDSINHTSEKATLKTIIPTFFVFRVAVIAINSESMPSEKATLKIIIPKILCSKCRGYSYQ